VRVVYVRVAQYEKYGPPEVITIIDAPLPGPPGPHEVQVAVQMVGINPADSKSRRGHTPVHPIPAGIGREFSGFVKTIGSQVLGLNPGDEVLGTCDGALRDMVNVSADSVMRIPEGITAEVGAVLPVAPQTALKALESQGIAPGATVVVSAGAGGVGHVLCQLLVRQGARVIGTASPDNHGYLESLGVTPVSYGPGLVDRLLEVAPDGIQHVFDQSGKEMLEAALQLGVPRSHINSVSGLGPLYDVPTVGRKGLDKEAIAELAGLIVREELSLEVVTYPIEQVVEAFAHLEKNPGRSRFAISLSAAE
jgi:NADPH:quinone reductase-like Zn-dependent oxidoreductase